MLLIYVTIAQRDVKNYYPRRLKMKLLIVVDMQNDFIDGALGTKEAVAIVPNVAAKN